MSEYTESWHDPMLRRTRWHSTNGVRWNDTPWGYVMYRSSQREYYARGVDQRYGLVVDHREALAVAMREVDERETPEDMAILREFRRRLLRVLGTLAWREREVVKLRYGLENGELYSIEEVARIFRVTRERIRQIEMKAIRKLQHPVRRKRLAGFVPESWLNPNGEVLV